MIKSALVVILSLANAELAFAQSDTLATVGNAKITTTEFKQKLESVRKEAMNPPTTEQFLEDLVRFEIGVQEAEKLKLQNDPLVKERFRQVLYNALLEKQIGGKVADIKITEKDLRAFYAKNPELRLAHILIEIKNEAKPEEREATRKRANEILDEIRKSKRPFEEFVKLYSDDIATKETGGDIGFQSRVTLAPVIYDAALPMKANEIKGLIETKFGFHIVKLLERRGYDMADKHQIRSALFDQKRADLFDEYFNKAKKNYKVEINKSALKGIGN